MLKKLILLSSIIILILATLQILISERIISVKRNEDNAYNLSLNKINKLQNLLFKDTIITREQAKELFSPIDVTKDECHTEIKLREFYKDYRDSNLSLTGTLLILLKKNFPYELSKENILKVKPYDYNYDPNNSFAWNFGFLLVPTEVNKNLIFIKLDKITGKIGIEKSYIGNKDLIELLGIDKNGRIKDKILESQFLNLLRINTK